MAVKTQDDLLEAIDKMTVLELSDFIKRFEERYGVTAAIGPNKIPVIKVVRELTGLGLKEAKDVVDAAPKPVKEGVTREEAEKIKTALEEQGAKVEIK